jgi:hypothetical protein
VGVVASTLDIITGNPVSPQAITDLYQHLLTAAIVLGPLLSALGVMAFFGWKASWTISRELTSINHKLGIMWRAFCKQHNIDPNGGKEVD